MKRWPGIIVGAAFALAQPSFAAPPVADGALAHLVGNWKVNGTTMGKPTSTRAEVRSELGGAFLAMHIKDPTGKDPYEALVFFGWLRDGGILVHWLDVSGGETSRTLGTGRVDRNEVKLNFPYPKDALRDSLTYDSQHDRWRLFIKDGPTHHQSIYSDWTLEPVRDR